MSASRRLAGLACIVIALALLYPGVTRPVMTLSGDIDKSRLAQVSIDLIAGDPANVQARQMLTTMSQLLGLDRIEGQLEAYRSSRSIWGTASDLAADGNLLVAILIILFSVVIPSIKLLLQAVCQLPLPADYRGAFYWLNAALSKWSMTDVFVMALLVAYLAGSASSKMGEMLTTHAQLEEGFYYFLAYCLFSIASGALLAQPAHQHPRT